MRDILLNEYVSAGYYLIRLSKRADYMPPELMPDQILSASSIICEHFPASWAIEWASANAEERSQKSAAFGISQNDLPRVIEWATGSKEFGWPSAFYTLAGARKSRKQFIPNARDVVSIGLGLHRSNVEEFLNDARPSPPKPGYSPQGATGIFECISSGKRIAGGGDFAGFELLATMFGMLADSWLHHGLERNCAEKLSITPNRHGLIGSWEEAVRCTQLASEILGRFPDSGYPG